MSAIEGNINVAKQVLQDHPDLDLDVRDLITGDNLLCIAAEEGHKVRSVCVQFKQLGIHRIYVTT